MRRILEQLNVPVSGSALDYAAYLRVRWRASLFAALLFMLAAHAGMALLELAIRPLASDRQLVENNWIRALHIPVIACLACVALLAPRVSPRALTWIAFTSFSTVHGVVAASIDTASGHAILATTGFVTVLATCLFHARLCAAAALAAAVAVVFGVAYWLRAGDGAPASFQVPMLLVVTAGPLLASLLAPLLEAAVRSHFDTVRDLETRNRKLETSLRSAEASTRAKSQFLADMSHEIRTPMNGVLGMAELLQCTELDERQNGYVKAIRGSGETLLTVINDILDFSKIEAGKLVIEDVTFDPMAEIEGTVELFRTPAASKEIELACFVDQSVPRSAGGDPARLRQVLSNLIGNALKFTEHGSVFVRAAAETRGDDDLTLKCEVTDTGIGIDEQQKARLFESFTQAETSTSRRFGGTGLGLAICKKLVELMNGSIDVTSRPGEGSSFCFSLSLHPRAQTTVRPSLLIQAEQAVRALCVDDNEGNRTILAHQLTAIGLDVETVPDGGAAFERLANACERGVPFALVAIDFRMPVMDGVDLARLIRADARFSLAKLVLLTSVEEEVWRPRAAGVEFDLVLPKPVLQTQLASQLGRVLGLPIVDDTPPQVREPALLKFRFDADVLVAEDNPVNQRVARRLLEHMGCRVEIAKNGRDAVEKAAGSAFDLILMDCQMPELDGFAATRELRARETRSDRRVPIIAMTASAMQGDREACLEAGMDDYATKPIRSETLAAVLDRWLK